MKTDLCDLDMDRERSLLEDVDRELDEERDDGEREYGPVIFRRDVTNDLL